MISQIFRQLLNYILARMLGRDFKAVRQDIKLQRSRLIAIERLEAAFEF